MQLIEDLSHALAHFAREEAGASVAEYALVGFLIAVVCMLGLLAFGKSNA